MTSASNSPRSWLLQPRAVEGLGFGGWRWVLPGVGSALAWLRVLGVRRGMRVGLAGAGNPATAALLQAGPLAGVTLVLFNRRLTAAELVRQADEACLGMLLVDGAHPLAASRADAPRIPEAFADVAIDPALLAPLTGEDPALVIFTSGTSGAPKAARLPARAVAHAARATCERLGLTAADTWLGCLPLDHIGGAGLVHRSAACGYRLRLFERFDAQAVGAALAEGVTGISVVSTMLHRLIDHRDDAPWPPSLRTLLVGGGPLSDALCAKAARLGLEPCQTYGLSECASQVCTLAPAEAPAHRGSAGRALSGLEVSIVRADGSSAAPGESGGIRVRGGSLFSGYERQGRVGTPCAPDAWFATGDLGELDRDGFLTVHCRREDLILSGGENVYPAEIEGVLVEHPAIREAMACGLEDEEWGQVVVALLVARGEAPNADELRAWLEPRLAAFKRPRQWRWVAELPRTPAGKLDRSRSAALLRAR